MMYEVRGPNGSCQSLAVGKEESWGKGDSRAFPQDYWMHISLVHASDGTASIYWNGRLKARGYVHLPEKVPRKNHYVGRSHWADDPYFRGMISELHVFDYALTPSEIYKCWASKAIPRTRHAPPVLSLADASAASLCIS